MQVVMPRRAPVDVPQFNQRAEVGPEMINGCVVLRQPNANSTVKKTPEGRRESS
jgi:hypothetical protein